jgi:hypothetical protein
VDVQGNVTAVKAGSATITVTTRSCNKTATCTVTVNPPTVPVSGISITPSDDVEVEAGKTVTLSATVAPDNASNKSVTWSSLHTAIATVNAQGVVTGVSAGEATIRATASDGSGVTADKAVKVTTASVEKTVSVGAPSGTMTVGAAGTVTYTVTTANIADGTYPANIPSLPTGVSIQGGTVVIADNSGTLTLAGTPVTDGFYNTLRLTIDGVQSATFQLSITKAEGTKTVSVGAQAGTLTAGVAGTVTFPVATAFIDDGAYDVHVGNRPAGISVQGQVTISGGKGTLTLAGDATTQAGTTSNLNLTIDGVLSGSFMLNITAAPTDTNPNPTLPGDFEIIEL